MRSTHLDDDGLRELLAHGVLAIGIPGWQSIYLDAFGALSGSAFSFTNTVACLAGILAPVLATFFVARFGERAGYRATFGVFGPCIGLPAVGFFCCFASASRLPSLAEVVALPGRNDDALALSALIGEPGDSEALGRPARKTSAK